MPRSYISCPHGVPYDVCGHPVCQAMRGASDSTPTPTPTAAHEELEHELELPEWCDELRFDAERHAITLRAKAVVRTPLGTPRVATFDYEMTLEQCDAMIDALTTLRARARQATNVIDVPSSPHSSGSSS